MNATQKQEIRSTQTRGRAALDEIVKALDLGGYIYRDEYTAPTLYDHNGKTARRVPVATMERIAALDTMTAWREDWGGEYVGRRDRGRHNDYTNRAHCKSIADTLDDYAGGRVVRCPECGTLHTIDDDRPAYRCADCGYCGDVDDYEPQTIYDYFDDVLDIEYRCDQHREYRSVQIMVAYGGPNIYIDTASKRVELYWWGDRADWPLDSDTVAAVDEWAEELWGCL